MPKFVLDANVLIQAIRGADPHADLIDWQREMAPHLYQHSTVVSEILVGANDIATWARWHERWVQPAERLRRVITPTHGTWLRASRIIAQLVEAGRLSRTGIKPSFHNDCLLAAGSREHGYTIVTYNTIDFELIAEVEPQVKWAAPFP